MNQYLPSVTSESDQDPSEEYSPYDKVKVEVDIDDKASEKLFVEDWADEKFEERKSRKANYSLDESLFLVEKHAQFKECLDSKAKDQGTNRRKRTIWNKILIEHRARFPNVLRTIEDLKTRLTRLKFESKTVLGDNLRGKELSNGSRAHPSEPSIAYKKILELGIETLRSQVPEPIYSLSEINHEELKPDQNFIEKLVEPTQLTYDSAQTKRSPKNSPNSRLKRFRKQNSSFKQVSVLEKEMMKIKQENLKIKQTNLYLEQEKLKLEIQLLKNQLKQSKNNHCLPTHDSNCD